MIRVYIVVALAGIALACGSGEVPVPAQDMAVPQPDGGFGSDTGSAQANEAFKSILQGVCEKSFDCCNESIARQISGVSFRRDCATEPIQAFSAATVRGVTQSVNAGNVTVDASAGGLCRQALLESTCDAWTTTDPLSLDLPGCAEVLTPQVEAGDACTDDFECVTGRCVDVGESRICATLANDGSSCEPDQGIYCKDGSRCDNFEAFACVPLARAGETCVSDVDCASRRCESTGEEDKVCVAKGSLCEEAPR